MEQPNGFVDKDHLDYVCKLHKALYGLKQAPRARFHHLTQVLVDLGFTCSLVDTSLFILHKPLVHLFVLTYIDDTIVTGTQIAGINDFILILQA